MQLRRARTEDSERLVELWERSVRATHSFLSEGDLVALRPLVAQELGEQRRRLVGTHVCRGSTDRVYGLRGRHD